MSERLPSPEQPSKIKTLLKLGGFALRHIVEQPRQERLIFTESWWSAKHHAAEVLMTERAVSDANRVLLVIGAQHPLEDGLWPNEEFSTRLIAGIERAKELAALGLLVHIYIPGSRHMDKGVADELSLGAAGQHFVASNELPDGVVLHSDDLTEYYKPGTGVYNSGDEAFVSASFFMDSPEFGAMEVILGPGQAERWRMHAIAQGVSPTIHTVTPESGQTYHGNLHAAETAILAYTQYLDPTWQHERSFMGNTTRLFRKPQKS